MGSEEPGPVEDYLARPVKSLRYEVIGFGADDHVCFEHEFPIELVPRLRPYFDLGDDPWLLGADYPIRPETGSAVAAILQLDLDPDVAYVISVSAEY